MPGAATTTFSAEHCALASPTLPGPSTGPSAGRDLSRGSQARLGPGYAGACARLSMLNCLVIAMAGTGAGLRYLAHRAGPARPGRNPGERRRRNRIALFRAVPAASDRPILRERG